MTLTVVVSVVLGVALGACTSPSNGASPGAVAVSGAGAATGPAVPSPGCSRSGTQPRGGPGVAEARQDLTVGGQARWYLLTTPATRAGGRPLPLVVDLHGLGEGPQIEAATTQFSPKAQHDGFIAVFPNGTGSPVSWNLVPPSPQHPNHDVDFMNAMLDTLEAHQCVDESRVYATGLSDGALLSSLLACTMARRFAAFAPVAGAVMPSPCRPGTKVSIVAFHGTADPILHFNGGLGTAALKNALSGGKESTASLPPVELHGKGYPAYVQAWAKKDGCDVASVDRHVSAHVILRTYRCPPGTSVEFYIVLGGGHAWPGSKVSAGLAFITGPSTSEIDATDIIWRFFRQHRLGS